MSEPLSWELPAEQRCMFGSAGSYCGEPATLHVLIHPGGEGDFTMSCDQHKGWWDTHEHADEHPIGGFCGMPGTMWRYSIDANMGDGWERVEVGYCYIEGLSGDPALAAAKRRLAGSVQ